MAVVSKIVLKSYFEDGKEPDEGKYINLIDTMSIVDGVTDHGALSGLADDDHSQYLLANGSRYCTGSFSVTGGGVFIHGSGSGVPGTTGGLELEWDGTRSDFLSYNRNAASYQPIRIRGSAIELAEAATTRLKIDGGNLVMTGGVAISGGLYVGSSSPVTTVGRVKVKEHVIAGGGLTIGYVSGAANPDGINLYYGTALKGEIYVDSGWLRFNQNTGINNYTPQYWYGAAGLRAGSVAAAPAGGDITFADRIIKDHYGSDKSGNIYVPVTPDIRGTSWWGNAKSTGGTWITISTTFPGIPANVRAINIRVMARDSVAHPSTVAYLIIGPDTTTNDNIGVRCHGNNMINENTGICNVTNNNIYAYRVASGASTIDCWLAVIGYFI